MGQVRRTISGPIGSLVIAWVRFAALTGITNAPGKMKMGDNLIRKVYDEKRPYAEEEPAALTLKGVNGATTIHRRE